MATTPERGDSGDGPADDERDRSIAGAETLSSDGGPRPQRVEARTGDVIAGRYELLAELGRGAFGVVFRARDRVADTVVAIKMLSGARRFSPTAVARLRREVQAAWRVTHPGVVRIYDLVAVGDHLALSMELVDGDTLDRRVARDGRLDDAALAALALDLGRALAAAHEAGVTHRDLKPSNIMLRAGSGRAVITDFGLSRLPGADDVDAGADGPGSPGGGSAGSGSPGGGSPGADETSLTRTGDLLGTPTYMAPEQLQRSRDAGPAADVYSVGLVLFEAATGSRAHPQKTLAELMKARLEEPPPSVAAQRPELSPALARVIDDCLIVDAARRIPDARALLARLESRNATPAPAPRRRRAWVAAALAVPLVAIAAIAAQRWLADRLPAHDRRVAFAAAGSRDLDRALGQLAARRFAAADHRVATVSDASGANIVVDLAWHNAGERVTVDATVRPSGGRARPLGSETASSLSAALTPILARVAAVVDERQPERVDAAEREAMARLGARDVAAFRAYGAIIDEFLGTPFIDVPALAHRVEDVIARDPSWGHPYALLMHIHGIYSPDARAARERGVHAIDAARDPGGAALLALGENQSRDLLTEVAAAQDRAFTAAPDDVLLGWSLAQVLSQLRRHQEFLAVIRSMHHTRPDLQFGTDLEESMRVMGLGAEIPALQEAWLKDAPANEQAWVGQLMVELAAGSSASAAERARDILLLFGRSPQRLSTLLEVLEHREELAAASSVANELLRGTRLERALGWFGLGQIAMLQGRFSAAREAWRSAAREAQPFGSQGPREQSLEELVALDLVIGDDADLSDTLGQLIAEYRAASNDAPMAADEITRAGHEHPRRCLDVAAMVRAVDRARGEAGYEREVWRAAAAAGCARCRDVVRLGLAPDERRVRSTFALAECAEREGNLELSRDAFTRARSLRTLTLQSSESPATAYSVLSSYELGRVLARLGRAQEARAAFGDFMRRWGHADHPVAQVDDARRALAGAGTPAAGASTPAAAGTP